MKKSGKVWGETCQIVANPTFEFHRIEFVEGYKCSEHKHDFKWNGFYIESGVMLVRVWQNEDQEGLVDETILYSGDYMEVKPGKFHQFEGVETGVAFEIYFAEFSHNDIIRRTIGKQCEKVYSLDV